MTRLPRVAMAITFLVMSLSAHRVVFPGGAFACSCAAPDPGAPAFSGEEQAVFIGTAGQPQPDGTYLFAVQRWYVGGGAMQVKVTSEREPMPDGAVVINTCGLHFEVGDQLIMAAGFANGVYMPGLCSPHAVVASDEGGRLIAAAEAQFGGGFVPDGQPRPSVGDAAFGIDIAAVALGGVGIIVLLALLITVYAVAHRGSSRDDA